MRVLITGGAGFVGHHLVEHLLKNTTWEIVSLDRLDGSSTLERLADLDCWPQEKHRVRVVWHDLKSPINAHVAAKIGPVQVILHLAAASHVDRSIEDPMSFVMDNVVGTCNLLEYAGLVNGAGGDMLHRFIYFSTDEVFGPASSKDMPHPYNHLSYHEWDRYRSANPYAATKAGAEELCLAYQNTYRLPILISHCMNVFGERQHPEKFIPSTIRKVAKGETVTIHADATRTKPGSRFYIHARNVASAVLFLLRHGEPGDKYNIVGECEVDNLTLAEMIARAMGEPLRFELVDFHSSRPGHDLRYALSGEKMAKLGWKPPIEFEDSLRRVVKWTVEHREWLHG